MSSHVTGYESFDLRQAHRTWCADGRIHVHRFNEDDRGKPAQGHRFDTGIARLRWRAVSQAGLYQRHGDRDLYARLWSSRLKPRARLQTAFKGFGFYYGVALGDLLCGDKEAAALALDAALSLKGQYDPKLGLIPLGGDAEESEDVGNSFSSIDSLQATPLLFWAADKTGDASFADVAARHTTRVLDIHMRPDGSIVQSSELNPLALHWGR